MAQQKVSVEFLIEVDTNADGVMEEWDYTLRRHTLPAGGVEFMEKLVDGVMDAQLEDGEPGPFTITAKVDGKVIEVLEALSIDDVRDLEDDLVEAYKDLRGITTRKEAPERKKVRDARRGGKRVVKTAKAKVSAKPGKNKGKGK